MDYAVVNRDYGQGPGAVVLPVSRYAGKIQADRNRHYSVQEVLVELFGEDFNLVLGNYVEMEQEAIRNAGILKEAKQIRLLSYNYKGMRSMLQQPVDGTVVDFLVALKLQGDEDKITRIQFADFRIRYILDMRPCHQNCIGPLIYPEKNFVDPVFPKYTIKTNDYLLPILYAADYENLAHQIIETYFPEFKNRREKISGQRIDSEDNPTGLTKRIGYVIEAEELARRMGLTVLDVHFQDPTAMGKLFYYPGPAELLDDNGKSFMMQVKPSTILVSKDNCRSEGVRNSTIAHECSHMYLDRWFFLLQMMTGRSSECFTSRRRKKRVYPKNGPMDWMEMQCDKLPAYLLMERESTSRFIEMELERKPGDRSPERIKAIVAALSEHYHVSNSMAKYRMIELGYQEAEGINSYVDDTLIPDYGCAGKWPEGITYSISAKDAVLLCNNSLAFEQRIQSGKYLYTEGHFVLNQKQYVQYDGHRRTYLTRYARTHIDECCLGFEAGGKQRNASFQHGQAARNKTEAVTNQYRPGYCFVAEPGTDDYTKENEAFSDDCLRWGEFLWNMPDTHGEAIKAIMKKKGVTQEKLALDLGVDRKVIYNIINAMEPSKSHLVAVCVALKLPYFISERILSIAGISFRKLEIDCLYREFLLQSEKLTVSRCDDILIGRKLHPLFQRDENEYSIY